MPDRVICDTSPLFYLHRLRHLALLQKLYRRILVPEAVITELLAGRDQGEDVPVLTQYDWIEVHRVRTQNVLPLISDLGSGETEVLTLALEEPDSLVILDDRYAREIAIQRNIRLTGTAGVLLRAKSEGYLPAVKPVLDELSRLGFHLSKVVQRRILACAQE
ncbi:MAG: DUF3368 domain-containing protein [Nitrospirae bacterium]|nr:DUF3368 domain-containing protein [Nitrospirota bacterium]